MAHEERETTEQARGVSIRGDSKKNPQGEATDVGPAAGGAVPNHASPVDASAPFKGGTVGGAVPHNASPKASVTEDAHTATNAVPEGFTLSLALVDALPVILFALMSVALGQKLRSGLFVAGAIVAFLGGAGKVLWKLIIALRRKNVPWLNRQMRSVMPVGFALMIAGAVAHWVNLVAVLASLVRVPSVLFVCLWLLCMVAMGYFAGHRQQNDARSNWIEQGVNTVGQAALLFAVLLAS